MVVYRLLKILCTNPISKKKITALLFLCYDRFSFYNMGCGRVSS
ncbi:hypothetical protein HMPREF9555_00638 [Selenomonas artemidis F0399]|uniref:Uncharacterized protein n=1 Tax=Selenomonas artemidis F0399 TaxID=749551 RepID=E7N0Y7_9FIRM|nr:hypothetical protein HMPREF9555_00638 [Selenomonas artemidis F0399]